MKKITFTNEARATILRYLATVDARKHLEETEATYKAEAMAVFAEAGKGWKAEGKTDYMVGSVQVKSKARHILYEVTKPAPSVNWQAVAVALAEKAGMDNEELTALCQQYLKENTERKAVKWATDKQEAELSK